MHIIKYLTKKEVKHIISKINSVRDKTMFSLMYYYGLRCTELKLLKLENLDLDADKLYILAVKNGISGQYFIPNNVKKILSKYIKLRLKIKTKSEALFLSNKNKLETGFLDKSQIYRLFNFYCKGIIEKRRAHPHILRHSIAVHMADSGVPVEHIQMHLRHRNISSTMVYYEISNQKRLAV
jgi:integrase